MKNFFKRFAILVFSVAAFSVMTGCAITTAGSSKSNSVKVDSVVATPIVDGKTITAATIDFQDIDENTGKNNGKWKRTKVYFENTPLGAKVIEVLTGNVLPAIVNGEYGKDIANASICKGAGCVQAPPVVINNAANAGSVSQSQSGANVGIKSGSCTTCGGLLD